MRTFFRVIQFVKPYGVLFSTLLLTNIFLGAFAAFTMAIIKPVMGILFDSGTAPDPITTSTLLSSAKHAFYSFINALIVSADKYQTLRNLSLLLVVMFLAKNIVKYFSGVLYSKLTELIMRDMRSSVFKKLMGQSVDYFNKRKAGELMSLLSNEVGAMHSSVVPFLMQLVRSPVEILLLLFLLLSLSVKLSLLAFSASAVTLVIIRYARVYLRRYASRLADATAAFTSTMQEGISGIRVVKAFSAEQKISSTFLKHAGDYARAAVKLTRITELIPVSGEVFAIAALSVVLYLGGLEVFAGRMSGPDLMTFLFALFAIMSPTSALLQVPGQIQRGVVAAERVFELIDSQPATKDGTKELQSFSDRVCFNQVSFSYDGKRTVLDDVSFDIQKGKKVAVVGSSGSGKSTLIDLLVRFYDLKSGAITFDGVDIREFPVAAYRSHFGIVSQEAMLFNDTVANNISFGTQSIAIERIAEAARIAHADDFIRQLPQGYDTVIGDRGVMLSGGQRQRIAIARALALQPDILVFDEATSALDSESEKIVQQAISNLLVGRTAVIIAHRLSTIVQCDTIIVLEHGRISEQGTHSELLNARGIYHRLYTLQHGLEGQPIAESGLTQLTIKADEGTAS